MTNALTLNAVGDQKKAAECISIPKAKVHGPFGAMSSAEFAGVVHAREWAIQDVLVARHAAVIVGVRGTLKTCLAVDVAISVATGSRFLGEFSVPTPRRVAFFDGGGAHGDLANIARVVCEARDISLEDCDVIWVPHMPDLSDDTGRRELTAFLCNNEIELVLFDTLEQSALDVGDAKEFANALRAVADTCIAAGSTPVFVQHVAAIAERPEYSLQCVQPPNAAAFPFIRQWVVASRDIRLQSHAHPHRHTLMLDIHGVSGRSFLHRANVTEEGAGEGLTGRRWTVPLRALPRSTSNASKRQIDEDEWNADDEIDEVDDE